MPIYDVDDGTGRIFSIESDYEPNEAELDELISGYQPQQPAQESFYDSLFSQQPRIPTTDPFALNNESSQLALQSPFGYEREREEFRIAETPWGDAGVSSVPQYGSSISQYDPSLLGRFRNSDTGRWLFGPTEVEREAWQTGVSPGRGNADYGLFEIPLQALNMTSAPPPLRDAIMSGVALRDRLTDPLINLLPEPLADIARAGRGVTTGAVEFAANTPIAPIPGATSGKGLAAAMAAFGADYLTHLPDTYAQFMDALNKGDIEGASRIATQTIAGGALLGYGGKHAFKEAFPVGPERSLAKYLNELEVDPRLTADESASVRLGLPPRAPAEPMLPELARTQELMDTALNQANRTVFEPGETSALWELLQQGNEIFPAQRALAERPGGGEATGGKVSFMRQAEAPTTEGFQRLTEQERSQIQDLVNQESALGAEFTNELPGGVSYRKPKDAPTAEEYLRQRRREDVEAGLGDESGYYLDEPRNAPLPEPEPTAPRAREGVTIISPGTGQAIEKPIPLSRLQRSRLVNALSRGASEQTIKNILRLEAPENPQVAVQRTLDADIARYSEVQAGIRQLVQEGKANGPELMQLFAENEAIKNRHGGMPPKKPADIIDTLNALKFEEQGLSGNLYTLNPRIIQIIGKQIWNNAIDVAIAAVKGGRLAKDAINEAVQYLKKNAKGKFDEGEIRTALQDSVSRESRPAIPTTEGEAVNMRQSAARATESPMIPEPVQQRIETAPESFYKVQPGERVEAAVKSMTPEQLATVPAESNLFVASRIELADRLFKQGKMDDGYNVFVELEKQGTSFGQNINQFKRLPGTLPEHVAFVINKKLKSAGKDPLTPTQEAQAIEISTRSKQSDAALESATDAWIKEPTEANAKIAETALDKANETALELQSFTSKVEPKTLPATLKSILQGNLLTPMSQVANITGNMVNVPFRAGARTVATTLDILDSYLRGRTRDIGTRPVRGTAEAVKGIGRGLAQAPGILARGTGEAVKGETRAGLHPLRAWAEQFSKNPQTPTTGGKLTLADRAKLLVEGTFGMPAEAMLRLLAVGDAPFREAAYSRVVANEAKLKGVPDSQLSMARKFPELFFDEATQKRIQDETAYAIFQRQSKTLNAITNLIKSKGDWLDFAIATIAPYKTTPWNIVGEILSYNPAAAAVKTMWDAGVKKDSRAAKMSAGKLAVGTMLTLGGTWLYQKGLISPSLDEKDESQKSRVLAGEVMPPNHVNISGLKRALEGGDPSFKSGDETVNVFRAGGLPGSMLYMTANIGRDMEQQPASSGSDYAIALATQGITEQARFAVNQSLLSGVEEFLTAIKDGNADRFVNQYANTVSSVAIPNTLTSLSKATREFQPDLRDDKFVNRMENVIRNKLGVAGLDDYLPIKRNLWGEPLRETPEGRNPLVYQLFDISKNKPVSDDPVDLMLYGIWRKTGESGIIPSIPARTIIDGGETIMLSPAQYSRWAELVGKQRRLIAEAYAGNENFHAAPDEKKIELLETAYRTGMKRAKDMYKQETGSFSGFERKQKKAGFTQTPP